MKLLMFIGILLIAINQCICGVTEEQMNAAGKLMRDVCLPKFPKVSQEAADKIRDAEFPDDKDGKCYINCVMEMMQAMKKGKFNYEASLKQVDILLPDNLKDEYRSGLAACKGTIDGIKNHCDGAVTLLKCLHSKIPSFAFP